MKRTPFKKHEAILRILAKGKPSVVRAIINESKTDLINLLSQCALNILNGNVPLNKRHKRRLKKYASGLRKLASKKTSLKSRKSIIQQGGFIPALLGAVLPGLIGGIVNKLL